MQSTVINTMTWNIFCQSQSECSAVHIGKLRGFNWTLITPMTVQTDGPLSSLGTK